MKNKRALGNGLLLLTAFIWGSAFVFQRVGMESIEPLTFTAARMALSFIVVAPLAYYFLRKGRGSSSPESVTERRRYGRLTVAGGICCGSFLGIASILQQMGLVYTSAGKAGFLTAMYILFVPVIGVIFLGRKNTWIIWISVLLGVAGMYLLCLKEGFSLTKGDTLVCLCAFFFSFHILCCDHFGRLGNPVCISAIQFLTASVLSAVAAVIFEEPDMGKILSALIPIAYCGIVSGGIGYTLQITAQKFTDPTTASLLMSMESVFAAITGALLLQERMGLRELIGCIIMFTAIILVQIPLPDQASAEPSGR